MISALRILHLEDSPYDAELVQVALAQEGPACDVVRVDTRADFLKAIEQGGFDMILADHRLPVFDGVTVLALARVRCPDVPFLFVSGTIGEEQAIEALKNGATDYVLKNRLSRLGPAVRRALSEAEERTHRTRAEKALRESEERLKGLLEHLPDGVCLLDGDRRLSLANSSARGYLKAFGDVGVGEEISQVGGQTIEGLLTPRADGLPHEVVVEGASRRIFEITGRPITHGTSEGGWALVIQDVTQEREVLERIQQQDRLAAVGQMAAGIAHDFNNLLSVMMGFAQLIEIQPDTPESARRDLQTIFSQGQRASQMIRQIMDFSRRSVAERQPVDLVPFLKETVKLLRRTLPENIRVASKFRVPTCVVEASLTQLQQVITNLAVNARDAMPEGGELRTELSHLHVQAGEQPPLPGMGPGEWVVWSVSDTGTGMSPEVVAHIYEPFFTTKKPGEGTGLGMAQVYGIVQQHGGYIDVKSVARRGTTFTIYLPKIARAEALPRKPGGDLQKGRGEMVLVVEDEGDVRGVVRAMLEGLNYRVLTAMDGHEALAVYDRRRDEIALVLTDMVMPEMSGMELVKALVQRDAGVRVVVMTGYPLREGGGLPPGIAGWLDKPLAMDRVAQMVRETLDRK